MALSALCPSWLVAYQRPPVTYDVCRPEGSEARASVLGRNGGGDERYDGGVATLKAGIVASEDGSDERCCHWLVVVEVLRLWTGGKRWALRPMRLTLS